MKIVYIFFKHNPCILVLSGYCLIMDDYHGWTKYDVLGTGITGYEGILVYLVKSLNEQPQANEQKKFLRLNFVYNAQKAWEAARRMNYDIYFIDASVDTKVTSGRLLSHAIKELYPSTIVIGLSMQADEIEHEGHEFDKLYNPLARDFKKQIMQMFVDYGFLSV